MAVPLRRSHRSKCVCYRDSSFGARYSTVRSPTDVEDCGPLPNIGRSDFDTSSPTLLSTQLQHITTSAPVDIRSSHGILARCFTSLSMLGGSQQKLQTLPCASEASRTQSLPSSVSLRRQLDITTTTLTTARQQRTRCFALYCRSSCVVWAVRRPCSSRRLLPCLLFMPILQQKNNASLA